MKDKPSVDFWRILAKAHGELIAPFCLLPGSFDFDRLRHQLFGHRFGIGGNLGPGIGWLSPC
jgi:hypothetical protein